MESLKSILREELNKYQTNVITESQLTNQDQQVLNSILSSNNGLNEAIDFNSVIQKVSKYAKQGLLTAGVLTALMSSNAFSQQQKQQIQATIQTAQTKDIDTTQTPASNVPNFTKTNDPNVYMGKFGVPITRQQYQQAIQDPTNGAKFQTFEKYADWVGGWARPKKPLPQEKNGLNGKPTTDLSDKGKGISNTYYTSRDQQSSKAIPSQSPSQNFNR